MAKSKSLSQLKDTIYGMVDTNGNFLAVPRGNVGKRCKSSERLGLMRNFIHFLLETDFLKYETKMYIADQNISMSRVYERLMENPEFEAKGLTEKAIINRIYRDQTKLDNAFGSEFVTDILYGVQSISKYADLLGKEYAKFGDESLRSSIRLNLSKDCICTEVSDDDFDLFVDVIKPYLDTHMQAIEDAMDPKTVGYFNYLIGCPDNCLKPIDIDRKERLVRLFTGEVESSDVFADLEDID